MKQIFGYIVVAAVGFLTGSPSHAQDIAGRCEQAKEQLVKGYDKLEPQRNADNYDIWISDACLEYRRSRELKIDAELQQVEDLLRGQSGRYGTLLEAMKPDCSREVDQRWARESDEFRAAQRKEELLATCMQNAKNSIRLQALHELNISSAETMERLQRERLEKIAEDQRAHEEAMEAWRMAVERCTAGEHSYCVN